MWKRAIADDFTVVAVNCGDGHDHAGSRVVVTAIEAWRPAYWRFSNPDTYLVFFRGRRKEERSAGMLNELKRLPGLRIGVSSGRLTTEVTLLGKVAFSPVGGAVLEAVKNQG